MLAHLSYFVFAIVAPLIILVVLGPRSAFVDDQAKEALNFHITLLIAAIVSCGAHPRGDRPDPAARRGGSYGLVFAILAAVRSYDGEPYRYPVTLRFVT